MNEQKITLNLVNQSEDTVNTKLLKDYIKEGKIITIVVSSDNLPALVNIPLLFLRELAKS